MEENNKKIDELKKQIVEMQKVYDIDVERGKDETNDQIQANRKNKITKLEEDLKEVEIEKINKLENRKTELEEILKKKKILEKDKEQLEQAIYETSGENLIQDGKLVKSQEQIEYEKDLEKVNDELSSLEVYEKELSDVNAEIESLNEKYNIGKIYDDNNIKITDDININLEEKPKNNVKGLYCYEYHYGDEISKYIYTDNPILFDKINSDKEYAHVLQNFLHPDRIDKYSKGAEEKGALYSTYIGNIRHAPNEENVWKKARHFVESENLIYDAISKKEYENLLRDKIDIKVMLEKSKGYTPPEVLIQSQERIDYINSQLKKHKEIRPDLFDEKQKNEEVKEENDENSKDANQEQRSTKNNVVNNNEQQNDYVKDIQEPNSEFLKNIQQSKDFNNERNNKNTSITEYKKANRLISWIKEKLNAIKEKFKKSKNKDIDLDATGQAWQDYINEQEGTKNKKSRFIDKITQMGNLKSKEQQVNQFETAKKWSEQNKNEMQQEDDERDL